MKQLKIKDNQYLPKEDFYQVKSIVSHVSDKTLEQLEREGVFVFPEIIKDAEDITKDQMILQSCNDMYCSGNVMGFLGSGDERLVIESRFSRGENDYFFQYLLEKVLDFPNFISLDTDANQDERMFNLLLFLFPHYLKVTARKGAFKTYINNKYNDSNVRGTIDIARHIKRNIPFVGDIAYNQREYSFDNYLMELIRHTIEHIKSKSYGYNLLNKVKDEVKLVIDATPEYRSTDRRRVLEANRKNTIHHAYYHEYRDLQRLCILILQNQKHKFGDGHRKVYGILFGGAWLWEEYINSLIGDMFYHPMNKSGTGAQRLFDGGVGLIYPDFIGKNTAVYECELIGENGTRFLPQVKSGKSGDKEYPVEEYCKIVKGMFDEYLVKPVLFYENEDYGTYEDEELIKITKNDLMNFIREYPYLISKKVMEVYELIED